MVRVRQIDHVTLVVKNLDASRRFYVDRLGMAEAPRPAFDFAGLWFCAGETLIHLILESDRSGPAGVNEGGRTKTTRGHHLAFAVEDAAAAATELEAAGVTFVSKPKRRPDGAVQTFVLDPDGHVIELCSPPDGVRASWQMLRWPPSPWGEGSGVRGAVGRPLRVASFSVPRLRFGLVDSHTSPKRKRESSLPPPPAPLPRGEGGLSVCAESSGIASATIAPAGSRLPLAGSDALASSRLRFLYSEWIELPAPSRAVTSPPRESHRPMASVAARKRMIFVAWIIAGIVIAMAVADLAVAFPFNRQVVMDILFLLGAALVGYLAYDAYKDVT